MDIKSIDKIVSLCKRRGFIFQSSEIYGGLASTWDYGPLGVEMKQRIKDLWWQEMVTSRENVVGMDAAILMHPKAWEASGHVSQFHDLMMDNKINKRRQRVYHLLESQRSIDPIFRIFDKLGIDTNDLIVLNKTTGKQHKIVDLLGTQPRFVTVDIANKLNVDLDDIELYNQTAQINKIEKFIRESDSDIDLNDCGILDYSNPKNPKAGNWTVPRQFNLMFSTKMGSSKESSLEMYLRPETAQGIFVNFSNVQTVSRQKLPFGIAQLGKAFRNEITTGNFLFRTREFEQMELEFFVHSDTTAEWLTFWSEARLDWYKDLGINPEKLRLRPHEEDELAHYSTACFDIEYKFPFGWSELEGIADRGTFDLDQHNKFAEKKQTYFDTTSNTHIVPAVVEASGGVDRAFLTCLVDAYTEEEVRGETRILLKLSPKIAPITCAVFPLVNKDGLPDAAQEIVDDVRCEFSAFFDTGGSIGRRYRRQDEAGTPFGVTVDHQTLEDNTVTLRYRDTMEQDRIPRDSVRRAVRDKIQQL
jgi:glycyl-tRNA synthetase